MPTKRILIAAVLAVAAAVGFVGCWPFGWSAKELRLPGTVEIQEVRLASRIGGRVKSVSVQEGQLLKAGDVLATFEAPELEAQYAQAQQKREQAYAALERARNAARPEEKAVAEAAVKTAEAKLAVVKAGWRDEEVEQQRKELLAQEAELEYAKAELDRQRFLAPKGASTESALESARAAVKRWTAQIAASRARLKMLKVGPRPEEIAQAEAEVARAKAQLALTAAPTRSEDISEAQAKVAELDARMKELAAQLAEAVVKAPEPVVVEVLAVRPGDIVAPNQPIARVLRADDLWVKAYVPATELGRVKLNQPVEVTIDSHPGRRFAGTVTQIATVSEFTPRNVQSVDERANQMFAIKVRVPDPDGIFKSGMAADVFVPVE
ncbi:MAG TPA: HlyD family efflux transporter periplasmic adaptor subunit [Gemmataceae bacterium]|nr:HlyD family efflux transporter periplasmic adaptor subunit [Gemmataceae bacterium]